MRVMDKSVDKSVEGPFRTNEVAADWLETTALALVPLGG